MIQYRLDDLGWYQFEWLCQTLLKNLCGFSVEAWGGHADLGRDAYCPSPLAFPDPAKRRKGPFVFQAKFVENANAAGAKPGPALLNAVKLECDSLRKRASSEGWRRPAHYALLTNAPLSAKLRSSVLATLQKVLPECEVTLQGGGDICAILADTPNIRAAFPQLLGLADLSKLLASVVEKPIVERSTLSIERAYELARVFAPTAAYSAALRTLARHSFVVLTGPPEMGKTTIARLIGLGKLGEGWESYECRKPDEFFQVYNPKAAQVFLADDAFGSTEYRPDIAQAWGDDLDGILRRLDRRHWFLWTSRPAPLNLALAQIRRQGRAEHFPDPSAVVVDASELQVEEKALILYRHAKAAGLEEAAKSLVKRHARLFLHNKHFTPERVRRFVNERISGLVGGGKTVEEVAAAVAKEIEEPTTAMKQSFRSLPEEHQVFLIGMLDVGSDVSDKGAVHEAFSRHMSTGATRDAGDLANDLVGHFIRKLR